MIKSVKIENYKSIQELEMDVGRFNVIIGENGAGKSNFLESIAIFSAGIKNHIEHEFLFSRGIRVVNPIHYFSAFKNQPSQTITITIQFNKNKTTLKIKNDSQSIYYFTPKIEISYQTNGINITKKTTTINPSDMEKSHQYLPIEKLNLEEALNKAFSILDSHEKTLKRPPYKGEFIRKSTLSREKSSREMDNWSPDKFMGNIIIYSPENTALRNFYREGQIEPLGINGEGLLKLLKVMQESEPAAFQDVLNCLELFDWFETIDVPKDLSSMEDKVSIKDKYLTTLFDQRSANEGFLFVLFYAALFCSQYTPKIFAIDNIDASFNPKLCTVLIKKLVELAKKYDKQVFVTTHNPAILDGVDLGDEEQKLFVASRNKQGHTRFKTLTLADKPKSSTGEPIRLSEAFLRGYLGGLPKNF